VKRAADWVLLCRAATPVLDPSPTIRLLRDAAHPSYVELPLIAPGALFSR